MFGFDEKKKKIFTVCSIVYALVILLVVIITNFDRFSSFYEWVDEKLSVLTPLVIGGVIAYICTSLVRFFQNRIFKGIQKKRVRRSLSIVSAYVSIIVILTLFVVLIVPQLLSSIEELVKKISDGTYLNSMINAINGFLNKVLAARGEEAFEYINRETIVEAISSLFAGTEDILNRVIEWATTYGGMILTGVKNVFIGFLLSIYFVISKEKLYAQSNRILTAVCSKKKADSVKDWFRFADKTLGGFIVGKLIDATLIILVCSIVFSIAGIPYSILVSVFIGVCNIIPFFGPFIGAIPSAFIVLIARPEKLLLFLVLILIIQQIDGNIIEPKIVGDRTGLSSLGVLVAVTIMSGYFGVLGMFLGVPIFAVICAVLKKNIKHRLANKNLPTSLADYYSANSLAEPDEEVEHLSAKLFRISGDWIKKEEQLIARKVKAVRAKRRAKNSADGNVDATQKKMKMKKMKKEDIKEENTENKEK